MIEKASPFPLNIIHKIPIESPKKLAAINAGAYLAGACIALSPAPISALAFGCLIYGTFQGVRVLWIHREQIQVQKVNQAAFLLFSTLVGSSTGVLISKSLLIKDLFNKTIDQHHPYCALLGMTELALMIGFYYPLAKEVNFFWYRSGILLYEMGQKGVDSLADYPAFRELVLTTPKFRAEYITAAIQNFKFLHNRFYPSLKINPAQITETLINQSIAKATDQEFEAFIQLKAGQISPTLIAKHKKRFETYCNKKKLEIKRFCDAFEAKIAAIQDEATLVSLQTELHEQTRSALNLIRLSPEIKPLYEKYLVNSDQNEYRKSLRKLARQYTTEEEEDILTFLGDIIRETDCQQYARELKLEDEPGKSYIQIFVEELKRVNLDTPGSLQKAGFSPIPPTFEGKKKKLLEIVQRARGTQSPMDQLKDLTHGIDQETIQAAAEAKPSLISHTLKKGFFEGSMLFGKAVGVLYNPVFAAAGIVAGYRDQIAKERLEYIDFLTPDCSSFLESATFSQASRQYAVALSIHSIPLLQGYKIGFLLTRLYPIF